ncbi:MAG: exopolysaccharide biosynthesis polyprenyl glycosylphosphotransferase [Parcubacteria group bacterium]|nr:exopolysaccharide biosynthesis polyprenyl glycosylphosphotransferase [Parcubacteria group bacterium]
MIVKSKKEPIVLLFGDLLFFTGALWLTLFFRRFELPSMDVFYNHLIPFSFLFLVWVLVFAIAGLYAKQTTLLKNKLTEVILKAQVANIGIAAIFFFFIPYFGITPKTTLFIYLGVSSVFIYIWRVYLFSQIRSRRKNAALVIGSGDEVDELIAEINKNPKYPLRFVAAIDVEIVDPLLLEKEIFGIIERGRVSVVVVDTNHENVLPLLPILYDLSLLQVKLSVVDLGNMYEDIFDRVPLSFLRHTWLLENISASPKPVYDFLKRFMDIILSLLGGVLSLVFYPFVILAIKLDDGGSVFIFQERVGRNNRLINIVKFRTMSGSDKGDEVLKSKHVVTRVGKVLRKFRIDELPQLSNVLFGDLSLVGPRPELPALVSAYNREVPYYNVRHAIIPGLTGWAQVRHKEDPHHGTDVEATKDKISYDLHYLKERSFLLDIYIVLQTIKIVITRNGS